MDKTRTNRMETSVVRRFTPAAPQPSFAALQLAEELIDHVSYGLTRGEHIQEIATIVDEAYNELVEAASAVAAESQAHRELARLREALDRVIKGPPPPGVDD